MVKDENVAMIWTLSAQDIDDDEIVRTMDYNYSTVLYSTLYPVFLQTCQLAFPPMKWCYSSGPGCSKAD